MKYILVIDDCPVTRMSINKIVTGMGYPVIEASNGVDALASVSTVRDMGSEIALCLVDINMPLMNGIDFINEFRQMDFHTAIIVVSSEEKARHLTSENASIIYTWIQKPFSGSELAMSIDEAIKEKAENSS